MRCSLWIWPPLHCAMCQMHWLTSQSTCTWRVQRSKAQWQRQEIALHNQSWHQNPQLMTCLSPPPPPGHGQLTRPKTPWRVCHPIPAREFWHYWIWSYPVCAMSCQFMEGAITRTSPSLECSHSAWKQETDKERFTYIYTRRVLKYAFAYDKICSFWVTLFGWQDIKIQLVSNWHAGIKKVYRKLHMVVCVHFMQLGGGG